MGLIKPVTKIASAVTAFTDSAVVTFLQSRTRQSYLDQIGYSILMSAVSGTRLKTCWRCLGEKHHVLLPTQKRLARLPWVSCCENARWPAIAPSDAAVLASFVLKGHAAGHMLLMAVTHSASPPMPI